MLRFYISFLILACTLSAFAQNGHPLSKTDNDNINKMEGYIDFQLKTGEQIPFFLGQNVSTLSYYNTWEDYISGTRYRIDIDFPEPAHIYLISSDKSNHIFLNYPDPVDTNYVSGCNTSHIVLPDSSSWYEMDEVKGIDYLCFLFSKYPIDIRRILVKMEEAKGSFYDKVVTGLEGLSCEKDDVRYVMNTIGFSARTDRTITPVFVEIKHK